MQNIGWQEWVENGSAAGTTGQALRLEAIQIELTGEMAKQYDVYYRVHAQNIGWLDWAKDGSPAGTASAALRLEALQVELVKKEGAAPGATAVPYVDPSSIGIEYSGWLQDGSTVSTAQLGGVAGTTGQANPLTAIALKRTGGLESSISYTTHLANVGWTSAVSNGAISGEKNSAKNVQAITIKLDGAAANYVDIYYRAHVANFGWLDWAMNGQEAGTSGLDLPMEAYQVRIVAKGGEAPGGTSRHYIDGASAAAIRASLNISENYHAELFHGPKPAEYQKYIVMHDTEGGGNGNNVIAGWLADGSYVASHFIVNRDGSIVQAVPIDQIAHHAGYGDTGHNAMYGIAEDGRDDMRGSQSIGSWASDYGMNAWSIGIEMVHMPGQDYPEAQLHAVDGLIAYIDASFGFQSSIIDHKAWRSGNSDCDPNFQGYLANLQRYRTHDGSRYIP